VTVNTLTKVNTFLSPHSLEQRDITIPYDVKKKSKGKIFPVLTMKAHRRSRVTAPLIVDLDSRWK
jgi:hypothetical protein